MSKEKDMRLPCPVIPVNSPKQGTFDCYVLVCENLDWSIPAWDFLKTPILEAKKVDKAAGVDTLLFSCSQGWPVVHAPTGPVNRDYDDVRRYGEAAASGIKRALKAGSKCPLLVTIATGTFPNAWSVSLLGALHALFVPIELREAYPDKKQKVDHLGVVLFDENCNLDYVKAIESGRYVCQDIGGSDPERMAAPRVEEYIRELFHGSAVKVTVIKDADKFENNYPLYAAVNRCSRVVERHTGRIIDLEYVGEGDIQKTILLVGKGVTYDTGGADIKAGGVMAGMSRDKCGAAAVAGFFQTLAVLKPKGIKVLGTMAMVRNSVGAECYVADEIITSAAGTRVRVGNTDAEGRMAMADCLHHMKVRALAEKKEGRDTHIVTIATLTGHAVLAMGPAYSIVIDNGPAAGTKFAQNIQQAGHDMGDPFEISTVRREDYDFTKAHSEYADVLQCNNKPSSQTARGHQFPAAFLIRAAGLDKHGIDSDKPLCYSHFDIAGSSGEFPQVPTGAPVVTMVENFLKSHC